MKTTLILLILCFTTSFACVGQDKEGAAAASDANTLNECWTIHISEVHLRDYCRKYFFYPNGEFESTTDKGLTNPMPYDKGTYYYQPETDEIFLRILQTNYSGKKENLTTPKKVALKLAAAENAKDSTFRRYSVAVYYDGWEIDASGRHVPIGQAASFSYSVYLIKEDN